MIRYIVQAVRSLLSRRTTLDQPGVAVSSNQADANSLTSLNQIIPPVPASELRLRLQAEVGEYRETIRQYRSLFHLRSDMPDDHVLTYLKVIFNPDNEDFIRSFIRANVSNGAHPYNFGILTDLIYDNLDKEYSMGSLKLDCKDLNNPIRLHQLNQIISIAASFPGNQDLPIFIHTIQNSHYHPSYTNTRHLQEHPRGVHAHFIARSPNYLPSFRESLLRDYDQPSSSTGWLSNENNLLSPNIIQQIQNNRHSLLAADVAGNPNYTPTQEDIEFSHNNPNTYFASAIGQSPHYIPTSADIEFALNHTNITFSLGVVSNQNYIPSEEVIRFAQSHRELVLSERILMNRNYRPSEDDIRFLGIYPGGAFGRGIMKNPNYVPTGENLQAVLQGRSDYYEVLLNPRLFLPWV